MAGRAWGRVLLGCAVLLGIGGVLVAAAFGPDDRLPLGSEEVSATGAAVATAPEALDWAGPVIEVSARRSDGAEVFVGLGHHVDVADYLDGAAYTRVDDIGLTWDLETSPVRGDSAPAARPDSLDWWMLRARGADASLRVPLPDAAVDLVVMDPDLRPGLDVEVGAAWLLDGAFAGGVAAVVVAVGVGVLGRRWARS